MNKKLLKIRLWSAREREKEMRIKTNEPEKEIEVVEVLCKEAFRPVGSKHFY